MIVSDDHVILTAESEGASLFNNFLLFLKPAQDGALCVCVCARLPPLTWVTLREHLHCLLPNVLQSVQPSTHQLETLHTVTDTAVHQKNSDRVDIGHPYCMGAINSMAALQNITKAGWVYGLAYTTPYRFPYTKSCLTLCSTAVARPEKNPENATIVFPAASSCSPTHSGSTSGPTGLESGPDEDWVACGLTSHSTTSEED